MTLLTIALAVLLAQLFPLHFIIFEAFNISFSIPSLPGPRYMLDIILNYGPSLVIARWLLYRVGVPPVADKLTYGHRWIKIGIRLFLLYLILAFAGFLMSAVPYGGGAVPRVLSLVLVAAKALLFFGLVQSLVVELPKINYQYSETVPKANSVS